MLWFVYIEILMNKYTTITTCTEHVWHLHLHIIYISSHINIVSNDSFENIWLYLTSFDMQACQEFFDNLTHRMVLKHILYCYKVYWELNCVVKNVYFVTYWTTDYQPSFLYKHGILWYLCKIFSWHLWKWGNFTLIACAKNCCYTCILFWTIMCSDF